MSADRIIEYYRMYEWRDQRSGWYFAYVQDDQNFVPVWRNFFAWQNPPNKTFPWHKFCTYSDNFTPDKFSMSCIETAFGVGIQQIWNIIRMSGKFQWWFCSPMSITLVTQQSWNLKPGLGLVFNSPVNNTEVMSSQSVYLTTLFLGKCSPLSS